MYEEYFGFRKKPFSIVPDPAYFFMSNGHREALAHLLYGTTGDGGFVLLTGEVGTGKTTVCRRFLELTPPETDVAFILNPKMPAGELLAAICDEFGITYPEGTTSIKVLVSRINDYLLDVHDKGRRAVLIVEEAQNLAPEVLEQIRLLTNLETNQRKLLQMIMIGQPELRAMLDAPQLRQLSQRVTARYHLGALSRQEIPGYVAHRLGVAGAARAQLFPKPVMKRMYGLTKGIPRLINVICDRALLGAFVQEKERVDVKILKAAAREVLPARVRGRASPARVVAAGTLIAACVALGVVFAAPGGLPWLRGAFHLRGQDRMPVADVATPDATGASGAGAQKPLAPPGSLARPAGARGAATREMAYTALFRAWGVSYRQGGRTPGEQAAAAGLGCLSGKGGISVLREMDRPAMLRLVDEQGKDYYATLTAFKGDRATFTVGKETRVVGTSEMARCWSGDYFVLYRAPGGSTAGLRPGDSGPAVTWLEERLARSRGGAARGVPTGTYDQGVARQVREFQITAGMVPDGIAGPKTIIRLSGAGPDGRDPLLGGEKGTR